jgi:diadenosine tetraphosphate (Ap4A) HIT family hydrolase
MGNVIEERVELARQGRNPYVIGRMGSGWLVMGDVQPLPGYCLLLADPVVESLNALSEGERARYCLDATRAGDALLKATSAYRINYEIWGNLEPSLHTHIVPRYRDEPLPQRTQPACVAYDWTKARPFDAELDGPLMERLRTALAGGS